MPMGRVTSAAFTGTRRQRMWSAHVRIACCYVELDQIQKTESKDVHIAPETGDLIPHRLQTVGGIRLSNGSLTVEMHCGKACCSGASQFFLRRHLEKRESYCGALLDAASRWPSIRRFGSRNTPGAYCGRRKSPTYVALPSTCP